MSIKRCKFNPGALVVSGILLGVFLVIPLCFAGGAVTLIPAEAIHAPEGSSIPERRGKEIQKKVKAYKAKMKGTEKQQEQLQQNEIPKPKVSKNR